MPTTFRVLRAVPLAATALPLFAHAHTGADAGAHHDAIHALVAGFVHPLTGTDHLLAMLALGAWSTATTHAAWRAPLAFIGMLAVGALGGAALAAFAPTLALPGIEPLIAASLLVFGLLLATRARVSPRLGAAVAGLFALGHGLAHGQALAGVHALAAIAGLLWASVLLTAAGGALGLLLRRRDDWRAGGAGATTVLLAAVLASTAWTSASSDLLS